MYACEHDFLCPTQQSVGYVDENVVKRPAATFPARDRGDAKGTVAITTVLSLDESARTQMQTRERFTGLEFLCGTVRREIKDVTNKVLFMVVHNHALDIGQGRSSLRF
jgi:hypothetical protein